MCLFFICIVRVVITRYTVHGRGAKLELLRNTDASMDPFQTWNQSKNMRMELRPSYVSAYARIRKIEKTVILTLFLPVKSHNHFLHFSPKNVTFFRPKKGPRTGLSHSLTHLTVIQFSDYAKSMAQITERIFNEAPSRCRSQK